jgi:predicted kinase
MPKLIMLVGAPASGKTTWALENTKVGTFIYSTDFLLEEWAKEINSTYNEVFKRFIDMATSMSNDRLKKTIERNEDIVWDQTNLTVKSRKAKLAKIPSNYERIAVYFVTPAGEEHKRRLDSRPGKTIPAHILKNMIDSIEMPTEDEGFDRVIVIEGN